MKIITSLILAFSVNTFALEKDAVPSATTKEKIEQASKMIKASRTFVDVNMKHYNCFIGRVIENNGKCDLHFSQKGSEVISLELVASPEVAAPWSNSYVKTSDGYPMSKLTILVHNGEVISIMDSEGNRISGKIDFSR